MKDFFRKLLGQTLINYFHFCQALLANLLYGFPSRKLKVIGVTGTDGKTTSVNLIASILNQSGRKTSFLSTINAKIGSQVLDTGLHTTTPSSFFLQKLLRQMVRSGSEFAVIEVTSHALDQYRIWGIRFETAVLTNITPEHLDYHKTLEEYTKAKMKLFENVEYRILNIEDSTSLPARLRMGARLPLRGASEQEVQAGGPLSPSHGERVSLDPSSPSDLPDFAWAKSRRAGGEARLPDGQGLRERLITYGLSSKAQIWADNIKEDLKSTTFTCHIRDSKYNIHLNLPGQFNVFNALAATCAAQIYKIPQEAIISGLEQVQSVPGRMEFIDEGQDFLAMVDFAHTPNALHALTTFIRSHISGQLILVFGCAGERDPYKRPEMGRIADEFADLIVITREDNRSENVNKICEQIAAGINRKKTDQNYFIIPDRREALRFALSKAQKNDILVITGKGHEQSLNIDGKEIPWDDRKVMREELRALRNTN